VQHIIHYYLPSSPSSFVVLFITSAHELRVSLPFAAHHYIVNFQYRNARYNLSESLSLASQIEPNMCVCVCVCCACVLVKSSSANKYISPNDLRLTNCTPKTFSQLHAARQHSTSQEAKGVCKVITKSCKLPLSPTPPMIRF